MMNNVEKKIDPKAPKQLSKVDVKSMTDSLEGKTAKPVTWTVDFSASGNGKVVTASDS
ncbi:MAG: hypothetical protein SGI77_16355 [Pirellulaceae bacterium]|nr:hypothetical protein [Pirellulaceae bacterium]